MRNRRAGVNRGHGRCMGRGMVRHRDWILSTCNCLGDSNVMLQPPNVEMRTHIIPCNLLHILRSQFSQGISSEYTTRQQLFPLDPIPVSKFPQRCGCAHSHRGEPKWDTPAAGRPAVHNMTLQAGTWASTDGVGPEIPSFAPGTLFAQWENTRSHRPSAMFARHIARVIGGAYA